ncbi:hypothetical protein FHETE_2498 [Fusarium heterosporum]|uniref:Uncharacterized protein n=1 Tax=Fusarium heterosporum TaxID=42747 RepID=A0A8H5WZ74_FUSHE|nr:hypothetical protein FHETE_2498 [Fusarium heterosporum]
MFENEQSSVRSDDHDMVERMYSPDPDPTLAKPLLKVKNPEFLPGPTVAIVNNLEVVSDQISKLTKLVLELKPNSLRRQASDTSSKKSSQSHAESHDGINAGSSRELVKHRAKIALGKLLLSPSSHQYTEVLEDEIDTLLDSLDEERIIQIYVQVNAILETQKIWGGKKVVRT